MDFPDYNNNPSVNDAKAAYYAQFAEAPASDTPGSSIYAAQMSGLHSTDRTILAAGGGEVGRDNGFVGWEPDDHHDLSQGTQV